MLLMRLFVLFVSASCSNDRIFLPGVLFQEKKLQSPPAGFNPGNSRALFAGPAPDPYAAGAQTLYSEHRSREGNPSPLQSKGGFA